MPDFKSENLNWLDNLAALEAQLLKTPSWTNEQLGKTLNLSPSLIGYLRALKTCFDPAAIEKVRLAASPQPKGTTNADPPFVLSYNSANALARLIPRSRKSKGKEVKPDLTAFHTALDTTLSRRLKTNQIEALVESLVKKDNPEKKFAQGLPTLPEDLKKFLELAEKVKAEIARNAASPDGDKQTTYQDELRALLKKGTAESEENEDSEKKGKAGKKTKSASQNEPSLFWEWMLGVKFMSQLKAKAKKGELTTNDKILILVDKGLVKPLGWVFGNFGKLLKKMAKGLWHAVEEAAGKTVKKILEVVLPLLFIAAIIWAVLAFFHFAVISPLHWIEHKIGSMFHHTDTSPEQTPIPAPVSAPPPVTAQTSLSKSLGQPKRTPQNVASVRVYQPAISFVPSVEDPKILDLEIDALSDKVVLKDHPLSPDESMPGDVASSRMQDITDPDKYTMMIGSGKQTIQSVSAGNTTLSIYFKSEDPLGGFWGGAKSPLNFLWEDVRYIHINEIDHFPQPGAPPEIKYQIGLVVKGSKIPLTLQCGSPDDLENLVSTMEYFIRHSRLAHDAQPAGLPYPYQGLVLNNDCVVDKLWADSPMDKAGVTLGYHLWSIGKVTSEKQGRNDLEAGLSTLPVTFFVASASEWDRALHDRNPSLANSFSPKLRKVSLRQ